MDIRIFRDRNGNTLIQQWRTDKELPAGGMWVSLEEGTAMFVALHLASHKSVSCVIEG